MPMTPDEKREYMRNWRAANKDKERAYRRKYYAANKERVLEWQKDYNARNQDARRERESRRYQENKDRWADYEGSWQAKNRLRNRLKSEMWLAQNGCCYLCGDEVPLDKDLALLDHDHRCCPNARVCKLCARGVACRRCNIAIGMAFDDPDRLERMAANLRERKGEITQLLKTRGEQLSLNLEEPDNAGS